MHVGGVSPIRTMLLRINFSKGQYCKHQLQKRTEEGGGKVEGCEEKNLRVEW